MTSVPSGPRVPPHDLDAEESLLGAMLLSTDAISIALEICEADDFYKPTHGNLFAAISHLYERGEPVDAVTVTDELRRTLDPDLVGDPADLVALQGLTPSVANAQHYASIVAELALLRRLVVAASEISDLAYSAPTDVIGAVDEAERKMLEISDRRSADSLGVLEDLLLQSFERIEEIANRSETMTGTATGYTDVDKILAGLQPASLTIVGARPAMGKTSFALGMLTQVGAIDQKPALLFSLEMSHLELTQRLLASEARVDAQKMRTGRLSESDWSKVSGALTRLSGSPIYIDDNPHLTIMDIRARARRLRKQHGELGIIIIDYLQLMTSRSNAENRQVEVAEMSRGLKILARELNTPVVALSQLSRGLEARQDKRPMLSDLRESGSLEQDADVVMFLYREEVYDQEAAPERRGLAEVIVAKHRNGPVGSANLAFLSQYARFDNMGQNL
ncbi:MAG: replicative DNA helicase [Actinobacteria bacterium]|nr:replicative DNA helicase [Actinomycetota bacterium]MSX09901.1 replicative DNA helicase [Actinomycetota bacterium]MSX67451.1 replicative DNA helicase [Actinomycetota bacterium]